MTKILTLTALMVAVPAVTFANAGVLALSVAAPEVDGGTAIAALALLSGAALVLRGRRRS
jgi:hypothetical protein